MIKYLKEQFEINKDKQQLFCKCGEVDDLNGIALIVANV